MELIKHFKRFYSMIINEKVVRICILICIYLFIPGLILGVLIASLFGPEGYSMWNNYISDLGSIRYTPAPLILDLIAMIDAIFLLPILLYLFHLIYTSSNKAMRIPNIMLIKKVFYILVKIMASFGLFSLLSGAVGLFGIGLFSEDRTTELGLHFAFSVVVFAGLTFGSLFIGLSILLGKTIFPHLLGFYMIVGPFTASLLFIFPPFSIPEQFMEWWMLIAALLWLLPGSLLLYRYTYK